jgi:hypothetical protein
MIESYILEARLLLLVEGSPVDSALWPWLTSILVIVSIGLATLLIIERGKKRSSQRGAAGSLDSGLLGTSFIPRRTVSPDLYEEARERLRVLDLEREILGYAIRRLYEAHAEGKITEEERDRLAEKYRVELARIKEEIARGESIVALNELERMQEEFIRLFSERFDELSRRIEQLRTVSGLVPPEEEGPEKEIEAEQEEETKEEKPVKKQAAPKPKKRRTQIRPPPATEKSDTEKRVEQIVAEVEKVLKKLGRMEVEE